MSVGKCFQVSHLWLHLVKYLSGYLINRHVHVFTLSARMVLDFYGLWSRFRGAEFHGKCSLFTRTVSSALRNAGKITSQHIKGNNWYPNTCCNAAHSFPTLPESKWAVIIIKACIFGSNGPSAKLFTISKCGINECTWLIYLPKLLLKCICRLLLCYSRTENLQTILQRLYSHNKICNLKTNKGGVAISARNIVDGVEFISWLHCSHLVQSWSRSLSLWLRCL